jgi:hypothetical protein
MRIRTGLGLLICCCTDLTACAGLAACTASAPGTDTTAEADQFGFWVRRGLCLAGGGGRNSAAGGQDHV